MKLAKLFSVSVVAFCVSASISFVNAQTFSIDRLPLHINTKIDADAVRVDRNLQLSANTTITVHNINELIAGFLKQVDFPNCETNRYGYSIGVRVGPGESESGFSIAATVTGCVRDSYGLFSLFRVSDDGYVSASVTGQIPISFRLDGPYLALNVGELRIEDNALVKFVARIGKTHIRNQIANAVARVNVMLRESQASVLGRHPVAGFNPRFSRPPEVYLSAGGALVVQTFFGGTVPTATVNNLINNALQNREASLTH